MVDTDDDFERIERWRAGDIRAFEALMDAHRPWLKRYFRCRATAVEDDELEQRVWVALLASPPKEIRRSFRAYLYGVAHNVWARYCEEKQREGRCDELKSSHQEVASSVSQRVGRTQEAQQLWAALGTLEEKHRTLIEQHHIHELSISDLAELYQAPEGTIKRRLSDARAKLRAALPKKVR